MQLKDKWRNLIKFGHLPVDEILAAPKRPVPPGGAAAAVAMVRARSAEQPEANALKPHKYDVAISMATTRVAAASGTGANRRDAFGGGDTRGARGRAGARGARGARGGVRGA